jgi:hypothetical protein
MTEVILSITERQCPSMFELLENPVFIKPAIPHIGLAYLPQTKLVRSTDLHMANAVAR